jgi:hypothetical protein
MSGEDLFRKHFGSTGSETGDSLLGIGVGALTDPLTYAGGFLGRAAGKALGGAADAASMARGPGYKTVGQALVDSAAGKAGSGTAGGIEFLTSHPGWNKALSEIPEGSQFLAGGAEASVFRAPDGSVTRLQRVLPGEATRPIDPGVLPTTRAIDFPGGNTNLRVERSPFAPAMGQVESGKPWARASDFQDSNVWNTTKDLQEQLAGRGTDFLDSHPGNVGMYQGNPVVIDSGAMQSLKPGQRPYSADLSPKGDAIAAAAQRWTDAGAIPPQLSPLVNSRDPSVLMRYLLDSMGGQPALQRALAAGQSAPGYQQAFGQAGAFAGGGLVGAARGF